MYGLIGVQFKRPSGFLGRIISALMKKGNLFAYDILLEGMEIKDHDKVFEIGYGHGLGIKKVLSCASCTVSGIDFSGLMFAEAKKRNSKEIQQKKAYLYLGDFLSYELEANRFDKIFCVNVIYFWDNLEKPFSKIWNGLTDGGQFWFFMAHPDTLNKLKFTKENIFKKYSIEYVTEKLELSGFSKVNHKFERGYFVKCVK